METARVEAPSEQFRLEFLGSDLREVSLRVSGELDLAAAPALEQFLRVYRESKALLVRLDLSGVTFLDCSCVGVLLRSHRASRRARQPLFFDGVTPRMFQVIELLGLDELLQVPPLRHIPPQATGPNAHASVPSTATTEGAPL